MQVKKFIRKNEDIQNFEVKMVIIGCDVEALYPSLEIDECCKVVEEEVMRSTITWGDIDYLEGARFIALHRSTEYCRNHELRKVLPVRRRRTGSKPGITGKGPLGAERGDTEQWHFPKVKLTERQKRLIIAEVIKIIAEVMFKNHLYTFGGQVFKQKQGGHIGLRGTCAIARLTMCHWDRKWKNMIEENKVKVEAYMRYMDNGRALLHPLRHGWHWNNGELRYTKRWEEEDRTLSGLEITRRALEASFQEVFTSLRFTTKAGEGSEEWLPTLDIKLRVE